jgi:hypothetical protein
VVNVDGVAPKQKGKEKTKFAQLAYQRGEKAVLREKKDDKQQ